MKGSKGSPFRSQRWTVAEARAVLDDLAQSGLSTARFASLRGLGVERLYRWKRRLEHRTKPETKAPRFAEITIRPTSASAAIELVLPDGIAVRLAGTSRLDDTLAILSRLSGR